MRPAVEIPADALVKRPWARPVTIKPPEGVSDDDCGTVVALIERVDDEPTFPHRIRIPIELDPGDLARLAAGEPLWLTVFSQFLQPFSVDLDPPTSDLVVPPQPLTDGRINGERPDGGGGS